MEDEQFELNDGMMEDIRFFMKAMDTLKANGMLDGHNRRIDGDKGFRPDDPVVIDETEEYVHLEYSILNVFFWNIPHEVMIQRMMMTNTGRTIDELVVSVQDNPGGDGREVTVYFDVTAGFNALSQKLDASFPKSGNDIPS